MAQIFPSLAAADQLNLQRDIERLQPHCQGFHLDVMDNHFVPNITWGADTVNAISAFTDRQLWVHLMVEKPEIFLETLTLQPNSILTFHIESKSKNINLINRIAEKKWVPSLAVSPKTPIEEMLSLLNLVHHVTIMSVEPGFAGQAFLPSVLDKIDRLVGYRQTSGLPITIAMDGGINEKNITDLARRGVNMFGVASAIFGKPDPVAALKNLNELAQ